MAWPSYGRMLLAIISSLSLSAPAQQELRSQVCVEPRGPLTQSTPTLAPCRLRPSNGRQQCVVCPPRSNRHRRTKPVRPWCACEKAELDQKPDRADDRDEADQQPPA